MNANVLTAMIQTEGNKPAIPLDDGLVFRFFVSVKNGSFLNFTALKMVGVADGVYYFSNKSNNKKNNHLYLSAPVPLYKNTDTYEMGAVVKKTSRVFECIRSSSSTNKHDTTDTDFWRDIVIHQANFLPAYADTQNYTTGDLVKVGQNMFTCLQPSSASDKHTTTETAFWEEITEIPYVNNADLGNAVTIGGEPILPKTFAVIDIFNGAGEAADFTLLKATGEITAPDFFIRYRNRSTTWKYISQKNTVTAISDVNSIYTFSNTVVNNEFVSQVPIPLSFAPLGSIKMNATVNSRPLEITGLQNPAATFITPTDNTSNYRLFSEIYLNY